MTNDLLFACLAEERSIFRDFNSYKDIGNFQVFSSPGLSEIAHWNLAYPLKSSHLTPNPEELRSIKLLFKQQNLSGHILVTDKNQSGGSAEESEYFLLTGAPKLDKSSLVNEMTHVESELEQFCNLIQTSFSLKSETIAYFKIKMTMLSVRSETKFYIIKLQNNIVGGCSTFRTDSGATFMFNVAIHPRVQKRGLAKDIISYAAKKNTTPLYTYSHNPIMRESILPSIGFTSIGTIWCRPVSMFLTE